MSSHTAGGRAAFFDVDGTLASSNVVLCYLDFQLYRLPPLKRLAYISFLLPRIPYYLMLDRLSRNRFNRAFFRSYKGVKIEELEAWAVEANNRFWRKRIFPDAVNAVERHRSQGHRIVLISGGSEQTLQPLVHLLSADLLFATQLQREGTRLTGRLAEGPVSEDAKAQAAHKAAEELSLDLKLCHAYADSYADRELLEAVGNPTAVNPDGRLRRLAQARNWPILRWGPQSGPR